MADEIQPGQRDLLARVKAYALEKCREIETLPSFQWGSIEERRTRRYPFERNYKEYSTILKDLAATCEKLPSSAYVLDIGAGRGIALSEMRERYGFHVVATGISRPDDITCPFVEAVASALPFPDDTFDLVVSFNAISWEPDQIAALEEVRRVLKTNQVAHIYLHPFTYSVWLTFGDSFWREIKVDPLEYRRYEFIPGRYAKEAWLKVTSVELHDPSPEHRVGYYLIVCG